MLAQATLPHGRGRPEDIVEAVRRGIDIFDCVLPTRHARNAHLFTRSGVVNIRNAAHQKDTGRSIRDAMLHLPGTTAAAICGIWTNAARFWART